MRKIIMMFPVLLLTACEAEPVDAPQIKAMRDDLGGRLFYIESDGRHDGKRTTLILACHGDGDNLVMFKTAVVPATPPAAGTVFFDYAADAEKGRQEATWSSDDVWSFKDHRFSNALVKKILKAQSVTVRFPSETGAAHMAKWSRETAEDLRVQMLGWCLK